MINDIIETQKNTALSNDLLNEISSLENYAQTLAIQNNNDRNQAIDVIKEIKRSRKRVVEFFKDSKEKAHATWKSIVAQEKRFTDQLDRFERSLKNKVTEYERIEEEKREAERQRLQAKADEEARRERERLLKRAEKVKTPEKKEMLMEQAETITAPSVQINEQEKTEGVASQKLWKARVTDEKLVPREWLIVNQKALDAYAKATKGAVKVPGVEFYYEKYLSVRTK